MFVRPYINLINEESLSRVTLEIKNTYVEFIAVLPISIDPKIFMAQHEQLFTMSFLVGLAP